MISYYNDTLYPLQDSVLTIISQLNSPFYLTGGTALSRAYLNHRYSDDLDFFVNQHPQFTTHAHNIINQLTQLHKVQITHQSKSYYSLQIDQILKVEFVNDIQYHYGSTATTPLFANTDNILNILSNKLTALIGRDEPKDIVDIWAIAKSTQIDWPKIFQDANSKAVGIFPPQIAQKLTEFPINLLNQIKWINSTPTPLNFQQDITKICDAILMVKNNTNS